MSNSAKNILAAAALLLAAGPAAWGNDIRVGGYLPGYAARNIDFDLIEGIDELFLF